MVNRKTNSMNVFYIPSWYPSTSNPIYGIFVQEEIELFKRFGAVDNVAVSLWGQGHESSLLWTRQPIRSLKKIFDRESAEIIEREPGFNEYYNPRLIWNRAILRGNLRSIYKANCENFNQAQQDVGKIDLVHVYASYPGAMIGACLARKHGIPFVVSTAMSPFPFREFLDRKGRLVSWLRQPLQEASKLIVTSRRAAEEAASQDLDHTVIVPRIRDLDYFVPGDTSPTDGKVRLLAVGRLVPQKGFDLLLKAFARTPDHFLLTILGEGEDRELLENMIDSLSLRERVSLLGESSREEVITQMQSCDVFVLSSRHESFGNVVVEAGACGKPVIATRCGGPEDIMTEKMGLLVDPEDVEQLAESLLQAPALLSKLSPQQIRNEVVTRFHPETLTEKIASIYEEVTSQYRV
jgi:glycosyltransferase involved in cell wall biosynthesis